jgi:cytosine/adenosine deaminase-related metal-dependent hydrolase
MAERLLIEARNRTLAVDGGVIVEPSGRHDVTLRFPDAELRPGLINAHDHLHRNHYGRLGFPPYPNAQAWGEDVQRRCRATIERGRALSRRQALLTGAWKNLFSGVTTVVHHDLWEADFEVDFPLRVARLDCPSSLELMPSRGNRPDRAFCLHLAEGTDHASARELHELMARGFLDHRLLAVHGVGMDQAGIALFRASGAALVWCPTSNLFLLGQTVSEEVLAEGVDVLLGSDSLVSGEGNLLDEIRAARRLGLLCDRRLEAAVGETAAQRLGLAEPSLEPGTKADLVVLSRGLLEASAHDVELVIAGGVPRVAGPAAGARLAEIGLPGCLMAVGGVRRWVHGPGLHDPNRKGRCEAVRQVA